MASLFGYEVETPEEILAQRNAEYEALKARDPSNPQLAMSQAIFNLVGSPELSQARARKNALAQAMQTFKAPEGADEYDMQIAQAEHIRNNMAKVDPNISLQANERILALQQERQQQARLKTDEKFDQLRLDEAEDIVRRAKQRVVFRTDPETGARMAIKILPDGITDEEALAVQEEIQAKDPDRLYQVLPGTELWKQGELFKPPYRGQGRGGVGSAEQEHGLKSTELAAHRANLKNARDALQAFGGMAEVLDRNVFALDNWTKQAAVKGGGLYNSLERITNEFSQEARDFNESTYDTLFAKGVDKFERTRGRGEFEKTVLRNQVDSAVAGAMVKTVAYTIAKALDPGGRLSNQDVDMAIEMVVGNGDPTVILELLEDRMDKIHKGLMESRLAAENGYLGPIGEASLLAYEEQKLETEQQIMKLAEQVKAAKRARQDLNAGQGGSTPKIDRAALEAERRRRQQ